MLVSHAHRFIFIKPRKVAGTSIELALSPFLQPGDCATPIEPEEEPLRKAASGVHVGRIKNKLRDHSPLAKAYRVLGDDIRDYRVVTAERNPWDRAVSQFFWSMRRTDIKSRPFEAQRAAFDAYTRKWGPITWLDRLYGRKRQRSLSSFDLYAIHGQSRADFVIFYEDLAGSLRRAAGDLGLDANGIDLSETKRSSRPGARDWRAFYDDSLRDFVARHTAREIAAYGYAFDPEVAPVFSPR